jgi:AraC-like DNA-binding protein
VRIKFFPPHGLLASHVSQIWIVEDPVGWKPEDIKTIVPNGRIKLVFPYRGALLNTTILKSADRSSFQKNPESTLWVLGMSDRPSIVDSDGPFGVLSVEFYPGAAYPFFPLDLKDLTNQEIPVQQVLGRAGAELQSRLAEAASAEDRVGLVQDFLTGLLSEANTPDSIVSHAMAMIRARQGLVTVNELTEKLGYSQRYLAMKFDRFVGLGPKTITEIVRFQNRFIRLTRFGIDGGVADFDEDYYDQSHFTKEFKRFSGLPPAAYQKASNEFLSLFYGTSDSYNTR